MDDNKMMMECPMCHAHNMKCEGCMMQPAEAGHKCEGQMCECMDCHHKMMPMAEEKMAMGEEKKDMPM